MNATKFEPVIKVIAVFVRVLYYSLQSAFFFFEHQHCIIKKCSHFDLKKSWVTGRTKIWPRIRSIWRIFESTFFWGTLFYKKKTFYEKLQIDSQYRINLTQIFTKHYMKNFKLTLNIESIWLKYSPNIIWKTSNWLSISNQFDSNNLQSLGIPGQILVPPVTQHFRSKWLHIFFSVSGAH